MANEAIKQAFIGLKETFVTYNQTKDIGKNMPFFIFDKDTGLKYLNALESAFNDDTEDTVSIYSNKPLCRLFNSLPFTHETETFMSISPRTLTMSGFKINMSNFGNIAETQFSPPQSAGSVATMPYIYMHYIY
jgi:hypothetical protein